MAQIKIYKAQRQIETMQIPEETISKIQLNGCIRQPVDFYSLAEIVNENSWHSRCVNVRANVIAGLGYDFVGKNLPAEIEAIVKKPNNVDSFIELSHKLQYDLEYCGNAYIEVVRIGGKIAGLFHCPARDIFIKADRTGFCQITRDNRIAQFSNYGEVVEGKNELIHLKTYNPTTSYYGLPVYLGAIGAMAINTLISEYNSRFFINGAVPDLAIIVEGGEIDEESEEEIKNFLNDNVKGVENSHRTIYIPVTQPNVKVRIEKLADVKEGGFKLLRDMGRDEVITVHGVPPRLVGVVVSGNLGGAAEGISQLITFLQVDVRPKQAKLAKVINDLFTNEFGKSPEIMFRELEIQTYAEKVDSLCKTVEKGIITIDEAREELGYQPLTPTEAAKSVSEVLKELRSRLDDTE